MLIVKGASQDATDKVRDLEAQGRHAVRKASPWIVRLGRIGLVAKGVVYVMLGWLAIQAVFYRGGELTDQRGALQSILRQPFGIVLLGLMSAGLFAYMIWRIVQALFNPEREPHDLGGWSKRVFRLGSGIVYGGLGVAALRLVVGWQAKERTPSDWTAMIMSWPLGKWLVAAAGLAIVGFGMFRIYKAWQGELKKQLVLDAYAARVRGWITGMGRVGQAARGVVFVVMGTFVFFAGLHTNPEEAKGVAEALRFIERAPYGPYLLGAVAAGLIAYGLFQFVEARYRRISAA
jgi:hypothetical protein